MLDGNPYKQLANKVSKKLTRGFGMRTKKSREQLNDREKIILKELAKLPPDCGLPFEEFLKKVHISRPVFSGYLKHLQELEYVKKDVYSRNYDITMKGREYVKKTEGSENIEFSGVPFTKSAVISFPSQARTLPITLQQIPFSRKEVKIDGYLYIDQFSPEETASVVEKLEEVYVFEWFKDLFHNIGEKVARKKGVDSGVESALRPPYIPFYQDIVRFARASLDFYAAVLLIFNGGEIARTIDWDRLLQEAAAEDETVKEKVKTAEFRLISDEAYRKNWLEKIVLDRLSSFHAAKPRTLFDSEAELENSFIEKVVEEIRYYVGASAKSEVKKIFDDFKLRGIFRIVPKYRVKVDEATLKEAF